jgi:hypothetical protein
MEGREIHKKLWLENIVMRSGDLYDGVWIG